MALFFLLFLFPSLSSLSLSLSRVTLFSRLGSSSFFLHSHTMISSN
uniref:Uncharacterized protein n=1 Tax=Rhizophora mucronata TaxID=61149 RepID=A0A2P2LXU5_RHIMU